MDALLSGHATPAQTPAELRPVAEVLLALQAPPDRREVAGWETALTVYRELAGWPGTPARPASRRRRSVASLLGPRVAAAAGAAAIAVLGGGAAAAYTGSLPAAVQKFAHAAFGAPSGHENTAGPAREGTGRQVGPSALGSAAYGLCNAYQHANASQRAVAFRNLVNAAGGADHVAAYCASVPHPGATSPPGRRVGQTASPADTNHGRKPTTPPGKPTATPGKPTATPGNGNGNGNGNGGGNGNGNGHGQK